MVRLQRGSGREIERGRGSQGSRFKSTYANNEWDSKKAKEKGRECERCTHVREGKGRGRGREESVL